MNEMSHDELLSAYLDGELTADQQAQVERRLASDPRARQLVDDLRALRATLQDLPEQAIEEDLAPIVLRMAERRMLTEPSEPTEPAQAAHPTPAQTVRRAFYAVGRRLLNPRGVAWAAAALLVAVLLWMNEKNRIRHIAQAPPAAAERETAEREVPAMRARPEPGAAAGEAAEGAGEEHFARSRLAEKSARDNAARRSFAAPDASALAPRDSDLARRGIDFQSGAAGALAPVMAPGAPPAAGAGVAPAQPPMPGKGAASGLRFGNGAPEHDVRPQAETPSEALANPPGEERADHGDRAPAPPVIGKAGIAKGAPQAGAGPQITMGRALGELAQAEPGQRASDQLDSQAFRHDRAPRPGAQPAGGLMLVYCDVNAAGLQNRTLERVLGRNRIVFDDADGAAEARQSAGEQLARLGAIARGALSRVAGTMGGSEEQTLAEGQSVADASGVQAPAATQPSRPDQPPLAQPPPATLPGPPSPGSRAAGGPQGQTAQAPAQPRPSPEAMMEQVFGAKRWPADSARSGEPSAEGEHRAEDQPAGDPFRPRPTDALPQREQLADQQPGEQAAGPPAEPAAQGAPGAGLEPTPSPRPESAPGGAPEAPEQQSPAVEGLAADAVEEGKERREEFRYGGVGGGFALADEAAGRILGRIPVEAVYVEATPQQIENTLRELKELAAQRNEVVALRVQPAPGVPAQGKLSRYSARSEVDQLHVHAEAPAAGAEQAGAGIPERPGGPEPEEAEARARRMPAEQEPVETQERVRKGRAQRVPLLSGVVTYGTGAVHAPGESGAPAERAVQPESGAEPVTKPQEDRGAGLRLHEPQSAQRAAQQGEEEVQRHLAHVGAGQPARPGSSGRQDYASGQARAPRQYRVLFVLRLVDSHIVGQPPAAAEGAAEAAVEAGPAEARQQANEAAPIEAAPAAPATPATEQ